MSEGRSKSTCSTLVQHGIAAEPPRSRRQSLDGCLARKYGEPICNEIILALLQCFFRFGRLTALSGGMDGVWNGHFPESETYFSEAEIAGRCLKFHNSFSLLNFRLRNLKIQSPKKIAIPYPQPFHTPTRLSPSLGGAQCAHQQDHSAPYPQREIKETPLNLNEFHSRNLWGNGRWGRKKHRHIPKCEGD